MRSEPGPIADRRDLVRQAAATSGDRVALVDRTRRVTYGELDAEVDSAAATLAGRGVSAGDPVLLWMANDVTSAAVFHAVDRIGAVAVVLHTSAGRSDVEFALSVTRPRVAVAPAALVADGSALSSGPTWLAAGSLADETPGPAGTAGSPDAPSLVVFTSGTTSRPKGVLHSANTLGVAARNFIEAAALSADDRFFLVSPLPSITGVLQALVMAPLLGARVVLEARWDDQGTLDLLLSEAATFYGGADVVVRRLLDAAGARGCSELPLRALSLGGAMLDRWLLLRAEDDFGITVMRAYGSSEAPFSTTTPRDEAREVRLTVDGRPLDGVEVRIGSRNHPNECCIRGPHMFLGYLDPADDQAAFDDDWFCTGDIATLEAGQLRVSGRIKDVVVRNAMKISMPEVETAVAEMSGVRQCAAYRVEDEATGERLGVAVIAVAGQEPDLAAVVAWLGRCGLPNWKLPEELVVVGQPFPETASGKVRRDALASLARTLPRQLNERLAAVERRG